MNDTKLYIGICDDEKQARAEIRERLMALADQEDMYIQEFSSGKELLDTCRKKKCFSIIYMDIYLKEEDGIAVAKEMVKCCPNTKLVFVTESRDFAIDAFELWALHYLVKPVTEEKLKETLRRWRDTQEEDVRISLKVDRENVVLSLKEIAYLKSENHKTQVVQKDGSSLYTYMSLNNLEQYLTEDFLKIKRGIIVNMDYIDVLSSTFCILKNGMDLEISRLHRADIKKQYEAYVMRVLKKGRSLGK